MTQRTDICNIALGMLGETPIENIDEDSPAARALKVNYAIARDATLEANEWSFAIEQFEPAELLDTPLWMYNHAFAIPNNILRVLAVERHPSFFASGWVDPGRTRQRTQVDHEVQGRRILTMENEIYCTGIAKIEQEGLFSNLFVHAFAAKLAMLVCYSISESNSKFDRVTGLFSGFIQEARSRDGMQSSTRRLRSNRYARVR